MEKRDSDDVFNDFEHKVTHKGTYEAKPAEYISDEEKLKWKYQEEKQALKDKHKKEMKAIEANKAKDMLKHGQIPTKNLAKIEKIAYIAVILVLVAYIVIDLSFYHGGSSEAKSVQQITAIPSSIIEQENKTVGVEVEQVVEEEVVEEPVEEEVKLSGKIIFTLDKVFTEVVDQDLGYINKVQFTIDNGVDEILSSVVTVYAYDSNLEEIWETRSRGVDVIDIKPGDTYSTTISLSPKTFKDLDIQKVVRIELNDTDGFVAAKSKSVIIT